MTGFGPDILKLGFNDLAQAPESPGIYAWYAELRVGPEDLVRQIDPETNEDEGERVFRQLLAQHSTRHSPPALDVTAKAAFGSNYTGELLSTLPDLFRDKIEEGTSKKGRAIAAAMKSETQRKALVEVLEQASPIFASPIYIGTSDKLRQRLRQHRRDMELLADLVAKNPSNAEAVRERARKSDATFAQRAVALDFKPDHLVVYVLPMDRAVTGNFSSVSLNRLSQAAEWFLNRWHRPLAGKL